jgi:hypothetical protein
MIGGLSAGIWPFLKTFRGCRSSLTDESVKDCPACEFAGKLTIKRFLSVKSLESGGGLESHSGIFDQDRNYLDMPSLTLGRNTSLTSCPAFDNAYIRALSSRSERSGTLPFRFMMAS